MPRPTRSRSGEPSLFLHSQRKKLKTATIPAFARTGFFCTVPGSFVDTPGGFGADIEAAADGRRIVGEHRLQVEAAIARTVVEIDRDRLARAEHLATEHVFLPRIRADVRTVEFAHRKGRVVDDLDATVLAVAALRLGTAGEEQGGKGDQS